jgi:hypothetical protein
MQVMTGTSNAQQEFHTVKRKKFDLNRSLLSSLLSSHHALNMQNDGGESMHAASSAGFLSSRVESPLESVGRADVTIYL